ncbi:MAG: Sugar-binding protein [Gemmatimonadales bacterium]|jgi:hypothetical protein|nr:Sugar-binding protein [Gemmatimonadales bacterium]
MVANGDLRFEGVGTLKVGEPSALIYRGNGLTLVNTMDNQFWTLLKSGEGLDKAITMVPYGPEVP